MQTSQDIAERMDFLRKRLLTLQWDKAQNQLNAGMAEKYASWQKEFDELVSSTSPD